MSSPLKKPRIPAAGKVPQPSQAQAVTKTSSHWQGPLPPPEALQKFDLIVQGGAERLFQMAEVEQQHRIASERAALEANIRTSHAEAWNARAGLLLGWSLSIVALGAAVYAAVIGAHPLVSVALVGIPLMAAVRSLIVRK